MNLPGLKKVSHINGWKFVGMGRGRAVWRRNNFVVKVPLHRDGLHDNWHEAHMYKKYKNTPRGNRLARCKLLSNGFLVMQYVLDYHATNIKYEDWFDTVDCRQVGVNYNGRVVAYDYGCS